VAAAYENLSPASPQSFPIGAFLCSDLDLVRSRPELWLLGVLLLLGLQDRKPPKALQKGVPESSVLLSLSTHHEVPRRRQFSMSKLGMDLEP
jgi:hypothetical protein